MVNRILKTLEHGIICFLLLIRAFSQTAYIRFEVLQPLTPGFIRDIDLPQLHLEFFEKVAQVLGYDPKKRFSDGHWAAMIEKGYIRQLLERLNELKLELR